MNPLLGAAISRILRLKESAGAICSGQKQKKELDMQEVKKDPAVFTISEEFIRKTKKTYLYMLISMPLGIAAASLIFSWGRSYLLEILIPILAIVILFIEIEILVISKVMLSKVRKNQLLLSELQMQRISGKTEQPLLYADIREIVIRREKDTSIRFIKLTASGNRKITVFGFEQMEQIALHITERAPGASVVEKTYRYNYNSGKAYALIFCAALLGFLFLFQKVSSRLYYVFLIGGGVWFLLGKPVSRAQGDRFRIFELICAVLIILGGLALFLLGN